MIQQIVRSIYNKKMSNSCISFRQNESNPVMTHKRAFTLIELLVVIAIIALLISILLPVLKSARESARHTQCMSQQKQIALGVVNYAIDHNGAFPTSVSDRSPGNPGQYTLPMAINYQGKFLRDYLADYIQSSSILVCPLAPDGTLSIDRYENATTPGGTLSYNFLWNYKQWDEDVSPGSSAFGSFVAPGSLEEQGVDELIVSDAISFVVDNYWSAHLTGRVTGTGSNVNALYTFIYETPSSGLRFNAGYRDGSVRSFQFQDLQENVSPWFPSITIYLPE